MAEAEVVCPNCAEKRDLELYEGETPGGIKVNVLRWCSQCGTAWWSQSPENPYVPDCSVGESAVASEKLLTDAVDEYLSSCYGTQQIPSVQRQEVRQAFLAGIHWKNTLFVANRNELTGLLARLTLGPEFDGLVRKAMEDGRH